ncbi:MAG: diaminopimelate epimerase [Pseudomonadota bacterium]
MIRLPFVKMHGTGNRILIVDNRDAAAAAPDEATLRRLGDSATGPGFDQLMWLCASDRDDAVAAYRVFNADGSEVEQCGNGLRCVAWLMAKDGDPEFTLSSPAGPVSARVASADDVAVSMGRPVFRPDRIPFIAEQEAPRYRIEVGSNSIEASVLSMGNPHLVIDVDDIDTAPVVELGPALETHARFPERTNVGFAQFLERDRIALRVFERGVGETLACGTGACAAVVSGIRRGLLNESVEVTVPGGKLMVSWRGDDAWLSGRVTLEDEGSIDL